MLLRLLSLSFECMSVTSIPLHLKYIKSWRKLFVFARVFILSDGRDRVMRAIFFLIVFMIDAVFAESNLTPREYSVSKAFALPIFPRIFTLFLNQVSTVTASNGTYPIISLHAYHARTFVPGV